MFRLLYAIFYFSVLYFVAKYIDGVSWIFIGMMSLITFLFFVNDRLNGTYTRSVQNVLVILIIVGVCLGFYWYDWQRGIALIVGTFVVGGISKFVLREIGMRNYRM